MNSNSVILYGSSKSELIARLGHLWPDYVRYARNTHCSIVRNVELHPTENLTNHATVYLLIPQLTRLHNSDRPGVWRLSTDDINELLRLGSAADFAIVNLGLALPATAIDLTMRDLYLLHERDPLGTPRSLDQIFGTNGAPLTWTDLKTILQSQPDPELLDELHDAGRLEEDQYGYGIAGVRLIEKFRRKPQHVYADIYTALWFMEPTVQPGTIFRGQANAEWGLESTLLRSTNGGLGIAELQRRIAATEDFLAELRAHATALFPIPPSEEQLLAVAQHFGFCTPLLDYTRSLKVAAYFATSRKNAATDNHSIGVIYYHLSGPDQPFRQRYPTGELPALTDLTGIRVGSLRTIVAPDLGPDDRIGRQEGVFVAGYRHHDFQSISIDRIYFHQSAGVTFEDVRAGVSANHLLPDQTPLSDLAAQVKRRHHGSTTHLHHMVASTVINDLPLVGTVDAHLYWHLRFGQEFLEKLTDRAGVTTKPEAVKELHGIISDYFAGARTEVGIGTVPSTASPGRALTPLRTAVGALESWAGLPSVAIWKILQEHAPGGPTAVADIKPPSDWASAARQALCCALFLLGWEYLRTVNGDRARAFIQSAHFRLLKDGLE